jgi:hypothetical protein
MPEATIRRRGGATRVRTKKLPGGKFVHIFIVPRAGPRGGHTVAGPVHKKKKPATYSNPRYKVKPDIPKRRKRRGA